MTRIGIIAALPEEADAFRPGAGKRPASAPFFLRRISDPLPQRVAVCGIGKVNAASAATWLIAREQCDMLIIIGSAGMIAPLDGTVFWAESAIQHDYGAENDGAFTHYSAGTWPIGPASILPFLAMADPGMGLPHARVASGDAFIASPKRARFLAEDLSAHLVDMETAAVAQVAASFGVPWAAIRAVSDGANSDSEGDFQANLRRAAAEAGQAAERLVAMLDAA